MDPDAVLTDLEPAPFWRHFAALTAIPRPSGQEEAAVAHVIAWAQPRGFATARDAAGNLVVRVPASPGREGAPTVVLQGHLDMVCERDADSPYDPRTGPVAVVRDGDWVHADGTTLGADNGVAIAAMLAVAEDTAPHGPLELLMTVDEEVGLAGARELDPALISGSLLLNLDSEEDATLTVGCAGSIDTVVRFTAPRAPVDGPLWRVTASGARGGHSGGDIALGRANAIKALARALRAAPGLRIAAFDGGASRNAIPREATALVSGDAAAIVAEAERIADAYRTTDPALRVNVSQSTPDGGLTDVRGATAWSAADSERILDLIAAIPVGPLAMSVDFPGVVETSSSLGIAATDGDTLRLHSLSRSANDAALPDVTNAIAGAARLAGARFEPDHGYPGWRPDLTSPLLAQATATHEQLFGAAPHVTLTHGGLEAAIIAAKRPGIDALSLGPQIEGPHAPGERLNIPSAGRFMRLLTALLDVVSR
jgi:dipeptidase D